MNMLTSPTVTMSSREIAELTEKRHADVMRDIRVMLEDLEIGESKFAFTYTDSQNKERPEFQLDRELTETLLLGYSAPLRLKVIRRLRQLEEERTAARPLTTTETLIQMLTLQAEVERRQAAQGQAIVAVEKRVDMIEATAPLTAKPQNTESISEVRARINRKHGLPERIINEVMTQLPGSPKPFAMVRNGHENAQGSSFAVWAIKDITKLFERFVSECRPATATTSTHPYIDGRFKLLRRE